MARRILLVDDEVAVLLTMKAVLEISGFEVDTAASAREGKLKLHKREYQMVITDMRMESEEAGAEVIQAARCADYHPAIALLTAFPVADEDWQEMGADKLLVKPVHTRILIEQIENLLTTHEAKLAELDGSRSSARKKSPPARAASRNRLAGRAATAKSAAKSKPKKTIAKKAAKTSAKLAARKRSSV